MSTSDLQHRIDDFMESRMEIFPELRHQPEIVIEEPSDRRTITQYIRDSVMTVFSARLS